MIKVFLTTGRVYETRHQEFRESERAAQESQDHEDHEGGGGAGAGRGRPVWHSLGTPVLANDC